LMEKTHTTIGLKWEASQENILKNENKSQLEKEMVR
jgi:hypothetical protein